MTNVHGFSSYQLVFGFNLKLPDIFINRPSVLEEPNISKLVADNLNAMRSARKAFVTRALEHNLRTYQNGIFVTGDTVYYKRRDSKNWKGPGKFNGVDGQQILIKHGSTYVRSNPSHVILKDTTDKGVHENRRSCSDLKEKQTNEDSSDSSEDNISDNYDSNEEDFSSEQADDRNVWNPQMNLEHADDKQGVDRTTQNPQSSKPNYSKFQNLKLRFSITYQMKMK